jgi:hypothetical protein
MTKLLGSNRGAKSVSCESVLFGFGFTITVKFGFLKSTSYKTESIVRVIRLKDGESLDTHKTMTAGGVTGGGLSGAFGYTIGAALVHSKRDVFEVEFSDGLIVAFEETDPSNQKILEKLIYSKRYEPSRESQSDVNVATPAKAMAASIEPGTNLHEQLSSLVRMRDEKLISEEEFGELRVRLLQKIGQ